MKSFCVYVKDTKGFEFALDIEANSSAEAIKIAERSIIGSYCVNIFEFKKEIKK